jgi:hypothetical protein
MPELPVARLTSQIPALAATQPAINRSVQRGEKVTEGNDLINRLWESTY